MTPTEEPLAGAPRDCALLLVRSLSHQLCVIPPIFGLAALFYKGKHAPVLGRTGPNLRQEFNTLGRV